MRDRANVGAIEAISTLRGKCIQAGEDIRRALDGCLSQSAHVLAWVRGPQTDYWKRQKRKREQKGATARSDLQRAMIAKPDADPRSFSDQHRAINLAKKTIEEADQKLQAIKYWSCELERQLALFRGGISPLANAAEIDLPRASHWLKELAAHLEGYLAVAPPMPDAAAHVEDELDSADHRRMGSTGVTPTNCDPAEGEPQ